MRSIVFLTLYWIIFIPANAHAYLDPASGNALVSFFVALAGALIYSVKSVFYKLFNKTISLQNSPPPSLLGDQRPVIFSEGKTYWTTFRPIVEEFIKQKKHFRYITLDIHDPALTLDCEFMESKRFPKSKLGFARIAKINAPLMLSTTPNIGSPDYPLKRPAGVAKLVHVFHAMVDVSCYRKGSLDFYDSVLMTGDHEEKYIRIVEEARGIRKKELIVTGLPCLDDLYRQKIESSISQKSNKRTTVLVAPSWGAKGCFNEYGTGFVRTLSDAGFNVIIRLHPHSYIFEPSSVEIWQSQTKKLPNVRWDSNSFGTHAMSEADILVSDTSSIRFDFAFLYSRPVITLQIPKENRDIFEGCYMEETWADTIAPHIGRVLTKDTIHNLGVVVQSTVEDFSKEKMIELRDETVANFGKSAPTIVNYLIEQSETLSMSPEAEKLRTELNSVKQEVTELKKKIEQLLSETQEGY